MRYNPALDGIRAVAIALVLAYHARVPGFSGGFLGVDVFFVLSGYLITDILLNEIRATGSIAFGSFFLRRLQRLYPAMLVLLIAYVIAAPFFWPNLQTPILHAGLAAIYMSDYAHLIQSGVGKITHLWSLAVEAKFYLLWPVLLLFVASRQRPLLWMIGLIAVSMGWRILGWSDGYTWTRLYYCFDTHVSGLMIGSALAIFLKQNPVRPNWIAGVLGMLVILMSANTFVWRMDSSLLHGTLVVEIATVVLIISAQSGKGLLASRPLVLLGKYSYGLYLWHMPIMMWLRVEYPWPITLLVGGALGMLASIVSYHTIEAYFRRRKKHRNYAENAISVAR